jgi:tetrahydromethanopterin S-methyltransferase subunit G
MALTTDDISKISDLFNKGLEFYVLPRFDKIDGRLDKVEERLENVEDKISGLSQRMDDHVFDNEDKYEKVYKDIGHYFENSVSKSEFKKLSKRVLRLERHQQI